MASETFGKNTGETLVSNITVSDYMILTPVSQTVSSSGTGGTPVTIEVKSTRPWVISTSYRPEWLTISPSSGHAGTTTVTIDVDSNNTAYDRTANLQFIQFGGFDWSGAQIIQQSPTGTSVNKAWVYSIDDTSHDLFKSQPGLYVSNRTSNPLSDIRVQYYFDREIPRTTVLTDNGTPHSSISLKEISGSNMAYDVWSVVLDFAGSTLDPYSTLPQTGLEKFILKYSNNSVFTKSNDWSQPISDSSTYPNLCIVVYDRTGTLIGGNPPTDVAPSNYFRNVYSQKMLTVADDTDYADILCQDMDNSWTSQDWISEKADSSDDSIIRLKNLWSGNYLNVTNTSDYAPVKCDPLNTGWDSQKWVVEDGPDNSRRLKNLWSGKYLTVSGTSELAEVRAQPLNSSWTSQQWLIQ